MPASSTLFVALTCLLLLTSNAFGEEGKDEKQPTPPPAEPVPAITLASILESKPDKKDYKSRKHCISKAAIRDHEILNKRHVVFTMRGEERQKILVQFGRHCFGLHRKSTMNLESRGSSRLCVGDYIRSEVYEFGRRTWGPRCTIPNFEIISDYQLELLRDALQTGRVE